MISSGMSPNHSNGPQSTCSPTLLFPLSETSMLSRSTMTRRMSFSTCTNSTSEQANGASTMTNSSVRIFSSTKSVECTFLTQVETFMDPTPRPICFCLEYHTLLPQLMAISTPFLVLRQPHQVLMYLVSGIHRTMLCTRCSQVLLFVKLS